MGVQPHQADNERNEEHLRNFVVNTLEDELPLTLAEDVKITPDELYEVLVGASAAGTSGPSMWAVANS